MVEILVKERQLIQFDEYSTFGHAEFCLCLIYENKLLMKAVLTINNIKDTEYILNFMRYKDGGEDISIRHANHPSKHADIWLHQWCDKHQCISMRFYPPENSKFFYFESYAVGKQLFFTDKNKVI